MHSFAFSSPAYLALLQGPAGPPPPLTGWPAVRQAILSTGATLTPAQVTAGQRLYQDLSGVYNADYQTYDLIGTGKLRAFYGFLGGTAAAHKFNWLSPYDDDDSFRILWSGGWVHDGNGAQANGVDTYGDTRFAPYEDLGTGPNDHMSFYSRTPNAPAGKTDMGYDISEYFYRLHVNDGQGGMWGLMGSTNDIAHGPIPSTAGLFMLQRPDSRNTVLSRNGQETGRYTSSQPATNFGKVQAGFSGGGKRGAANVNIGCRAGYSSDGYNSEFSVLQFAAASMGTSMLDLEQTAFKNSIQAYQTRLGRAI